MKIAQKYASAFLNTDKTPITPEIVNRIEQAASFLMQHRRALFLLKAPVISEKIKQQGLRELCKRFELPESIYAVMQLLMQHKRAALLAAVLQAIVAEYRARQNYTMITVTSAVAVADEQKKIIEQFADRMFSGIKQYRYEQDRTLIAGVRLQSDTLLWEYSINNYLRDCAQAQVW